MKNFLFVSLLLGSLLGCSSSLPPKPSLEEIRKKDELVLKSLDEEPLRQGTVKKLTEGRMTTEIWTWKEEHGSPFSTVETLLLKDGKLVSQTIKNEAQGVTYSRQFRDGKVFQISEERKDGADVVFLDDGRIIGRMVYGKNPACFLYPDGTGPRSESMDVCEKKFNTAP